MRALNLSLLVASALCATLATAGCLQDYDDFQFGAGGAGSTTTGTTAGPTTTGPGQTTNTTGGPTTTTSGPTTTTTTSTTNTVASTTMASTTSGGPVIDCDGDMCTGSEECCVDSSQNGTCSGNCPGNQITVECDSAADCNNGEICCLHESGGNTESVLCETTCDGFDNDPLCGGDGDAPCADPTTCTPVDDLPAGYESCQ